MGVGVRVPTALNNLPIKRFVFQIQSGAALQMNSPITFVRLYTLKGPRKMPTLDSPQCFLHSLGAEPAEGGSQLRQEHPKYPLYN